MHIVFPRSGWSWLQRALKPRENVKWEPVKGVVAAQALTSPSLSTYQPSYKVSGYQRSVFHRLTPFSRFLLAIVAIGILAGFAVLVSRALASTSSTELLSERLGEVPSSTQSSAQQFVPIVTIHPTEVIPPTETPEPTAVPTIDVTHAPWVNQLAKQPDGTLLAPKNVIAQAIAELSVYYSMQRDMSLDDYLARRDEILTTYFTGVALDSMRQLEEGRDLYLVNRAGRFTIEIRSFSPDGLTAKAGIITRDWVGDLYDVATKQLMVKGRARKDTLTIMTISYDPISGHWTFAVIDEVVELET